MIRSFTPPHIRMRDSNRTVMADMIIALVPLYFMAYYFYGFRSFVIGLTGVLTCVICEIICVKLRGVRMNFRDLSAIVTGLIVALLMPASIDLRIVITACIFAICIAKHPFGGTGFNFFNPAAAGVAFAAICWPQAMFNYPVPFEKLPLMIDETVKLVQSPSATLAMGGIPKYDVIELLLGNVPGPMGTTNILVIITCLLFLLVRKTVRWQIPAGFLAATALYALFFHRADASVFQSLILELFTGSLLFGAVFMVSEPVSSPKRENGRFVYAFLAGLVNMLFRSFGGLEQSICYTILLLNVFVPVFDYVEEAIYQKIRRGQYAAKIRKKI